VQQASGSHKAAPDRIGSSSLGVLDERVIGVAIG
jgi:hypothetical protein